MMKIRNLVAFCVAASFAVAGVAQDDLDALLSDLENDKKPAEVKAESAATETQEEVKAEEPKVEAAKQEEGETTKAEESKAEEVKAGESASAETAAPVAEVNADAKKPAVVSVAVPDKAAPAANNSDAELIANIRATERLRRESLDAQARREIENARECMENAEYGDAVRHYGLAAKLLNDRPISKGLRRECDQGIAEGLYRAALQEYDIGRNERAVKLMEKALDMRHPKARRMLEKWRVAAADPTLRLNETESVKHRMNEEDFKNQRDQIRKHLRRSRQYLAIRDMEKALEECEIVLATDPYNQDAIRLRRAIQRKRQVILEQERVQTREGMIADVDEAWRPVYAVNAARISDTSSETVKAQTGEDPERTLEQDIERRMKAMRLPTISFKPPATIIDAVDFFRGASKDYDRPDIPIEKRGFNFVLKTPQGAIKQAAPADEDSSDDFSSNADDGAAAAPSNGLDPIPTITASDITFYEALKLVCDSVDYKFIIRGPVVMVMQKDMSTAEILSRKYNVPEAFMERVNSASAEIKEMGGFGANGNKKKTDEGEESQDKDWKAFFEEMGVKWPEGSSIKHVKSLGKLYVRNTRENLAEFEKVLDELGGQPQLIEIETRFVEVSQEDLNSLGFEWILNSDYSLNLGEKLGKALGVSNGKWGTTTSSSSQSVSDSTHTIDGILQPDSGVETTINNSSSYTTLSGSNGATWSQDLSSSNQRNIGINAFGGTSSYQNGNRYLSTTGNHISGDAKSTNDQFMRFNAFLGDADLSMILHMLSQRSDTDLLSAPKVVTKSGENAVIKVVTEYIYPQDYDVQLQSSSSGGSSSSSGGSQSAILAVIEPQNFTMREVGVILDVTPTFSEANGGTIDLELKPQVVDEPTWYDYGMQIPFTGNSSSGTMADIGNIFTGMSTALDTIGAKLTDAEKNDLAKTVVSSATTAANNVSVSSSANMTWYDAPMKQPWFHVRSIDSKVSITPGATVVMGGLITESRKAMDDKVPFLGDLPYIGRLFRSHAEQTTKRNLLIFVTGRLITPAGREIKVNEESADDAEVKAAPSAE